MEAAWLSPSLVGSTLMNSIGQSRLKLREPLSNLRYALSCLEHHRVHWFLCGLTLQSEKGVTERRHAGEVCEVSSVPIVLLTAELCFLHLKQWPNNIPSQDREWKATAHNRLDHWRLITGRHKNKQKALTLLIRSKQKTAACSETVIRLGTHEGQGTRHKEQGIRG